jgi:hypothetical protein
MNGVRRAVVVDGQLADKKNHPGCAEIHQVSIILEKDRERLGVRSISRFTTILVEEAIMTNDPLAWNAIVDDIHTKDLDVPAVHSLMVNNMTLPSLFITCLTTSKTREQILDMLVFFYEISSGMSADVKEAISVSITCQWKSFVNCLITVVGYVSARIKDVYFREIGKFIHVSQVGSDAISCMVREIIKVKKTELLTIFLACDFVVDSDLFELLLRTASPKHTPVLMLAKAVGDNPDFIASHHDGIETMIVETMRAIMRSGYCDQRVMNALAYLSSKVLDDTPMAKNMATLLLWATADRVT